ncbi:LOW QUALITY PROTEIN: hypothetical protein HID58_096008 [Brassica napus]|uniref:Uncharacterized protein n=1 Tax=Brassica napus TaxID=3708 RepID=A0ABQ7X1R8_BRANA|nr:LOW QUALITY PROTEIN: hypothetical protein HID58_096008 [Brassica napus]
MMEFSLIGADTVSVFTAKRGIAFGKSLLNRWDLTNHISFAVDAISSSPVRASSYKTIRRIRKKRRTKRVSFGEHGGDFGRFLLEGDFIGGNDGPFGSGGGDDGGGGKGWNYGGGGWDESSSWSWSDPAMELLICWIALSNCVHFAFKRIVRIVTDGEREKLSLTLSPVC